jgi:hypothetical protein
LSRAAGQRCHGVVVARHDCHGASGQSRGRPVAGNIRAGAAGATTPFDWINTYLEPGATFMLEWWGWIYHGGQNGTWVNACATSDGPECEGSSGDITD